MHELKNYLKQTALFKIYQQHRHESNYFKNYNERRKIVESTSVQNLIEQLWNSNLNYDLNLEAPTTFNEKLNWLKINWFDPRAFDCADKNLARKYVEDHGLKDILIRQIAVYDSADMIDFDALPNQFVLKPSHDSGHTILCGDKSKLNYKRTVDRLNNFLTVDYEFMSGEWVYATKHKTIVCEEFMTDNVSNEILDYKLFCFNGNPEVIFFVSDRTNHGKSDFYNLNWVKQNYRWAYEPSGKTFPRPYALEAMIEYAKVLAKGFPFVRVDFYEINKKVYFGEMTFFHGGGLGWFDPKSKDDDFGNLIDIGKVKSSNPWSIIHPELGSGTMEIAEE